MKGTLLLRAHLRGYVPGFDPTAGLNLPIEEGSALREIALQPGIPLEKVKPIFVDGLRASRDRRLKAGGRVNLFPPVAGGCRGGEKGKEGENMERRRLGDSGLEVTPIVMGTWQAGKAMWAGIDDRETTRAIRSAYDAGITTFDTAEMYGKGHSERILGKALAGVRDRVVLATKVSPDHLRYGQVIDACERSLWNLDTDFIDLYQIHWPAGSFRSEPVPIEETMRALNDLERQGKIRAAGVSNFSRAQLEEACRYGRIASLQPPYSLFWRHAEEDAMPYCRDHNITILAYSPMAQGLLTGRFGPGHKFAKGDHRARNKLFRAEHAERVQRALEGLRPIAEGRGISLGRLALAWVIAHPGTCAIAGARNAGQVLENAGAAEVRLTPEEMDALDRIGRSVTDRLDSDPFLWDFQPAAPRSRKES
jgi:aryl-alcohol dehydrogenase-like predicted oxidoreductase